MGFWLGVDVGEAVGRSRTTPAELLAAEVFECEREIPTTTTNTKRTDEVIVNRNRRAILRCRAVRGLAMTLEIPTVSALNSHSVNHGIKVSRLFCPAHENHDPRGVIGGFIGICREQLGLKRPLLVRHL